MPSIEKIADVIRKSCEEIDKSFTEEKGREAKESEIIQKVINTFFDELKRSGFSMDLEEFIENRMEKKSKQCLDIAKESIDTFKKTNNTLKEITDTHTIQIEQIAEETKEIDVNTFKRRFQAFQQDLLEELEQANDIIKHLENEIVELQKQSNIDPLTKLFNRKALEIDSRELLKHTNERNLNIVAMMIDADDFKKVNDTFGHIAGDKVLILLAKLFKSTIREYDRAYRYGGEEFLILFNRATMEQAVKVAERIMNAVRNNKLIYKNQVIRITLSVGLTEHQKGDTLESMIERADAAVYEAKKTGKDRLVIR
ncbi:GGDEF domain-containing protein [Hydrogenimonas urashimensis]|uniref:GGDEF domain-containing protein n=1 Tax=Hydrogenimonas urashimensis TaxID=2740515 RepID=UPI001916B1F9|nr:GGDEF domain-containing protein [Hydrogenimonas urashimensis]